MSKEHNAIFICDKCQKQVTVNRYVSLPEGWSLVTSTCNREVSDEQGKTFTNWLHICQECHQALFGDLFRMAPSTNGGIHHILGT